MQLLLTNRCILNYLYACFSIVPLLHAIKHFVDTNRNCLQLIVHIVNALDLPTCIHNLWIRRRHNKIQNPNAAQKGTLKQRKKGRNKLQKRTCRDGTLKNQPNKIGTTPQYFHTIPTSCTILQTLHHQTVHAH